MDCRQRRTAGGDGAVCDVHVGAAVGVDAVRVGAVGRCVDVEVDGEYVVGEERVHGPEWTVFDAQIVDGQSAHPRQTQQRRPLRVV